VTGRRLGSPGLAVRLAVAFAAVAVATAAAVAIAAPPIVGRGFAMMQAAGGSVAPGAGAGQGRGMGMGPGAGLGTGAGAYLAQAQEQATITIVLVAIAAAVLASLLGVVIARRVARPLVRLEHTAAAVAAGDLAARSGLGKRGDEVGSLGRSFDTMAASLERNEASRRRFFQDAAHEMKTPLAVIEATAAAVMDGVYPHDDRHLETIRTQARLLGRVVDDLRTISLAEAGALPLRLADVDLADVAATTVAAFVARAEERGARIRAEIAPGGALPVRADADRIAQVVAAFVDNALRFTPTGGSVVVLAGPSPLGAARARVTVLDDGPGLDAVDLPHVFDRFYQADAARDRATGTSGLGLAIARAIVEAHGGSVGVANRPEGGAAAWLELPAATSS
jgi:two-component system, OmpR family, sensor histidine kinase BaeS